MHGVLRDGYADGWGKCKICKLQKRNKKTWKYILWDKQTILWPIELEKAERNNKREQRIFGKFTEPIDIGKQ